MIKALRSNADKGSKPCTPLVHVLCTALSTLLCFQHAFANDISANRVQLKGDVLLEAHQGQTLDFIYNSEGFAGKKHYTETHNADGSTDYDESGTRLTGEWTLSGPPGLEDQICYRYRALDPSRQHCFWIFRENKCLYGYSVPWFKSAQDINFEQWRSKGANREDGPSCDIFIS